MSTFLASPQSAFDSRPVGRPSAKAKGGFLMPSRGESIVRVGQKLNSLFKNPRKYFHETTLDIGKYGIFLNTHISKIIKSVRQTPTEFN
jgi:hypothetical protein